MTLCKVRFNQCKVTLLEVRFNPHKVTLREMMSHQCDYSLLDILCFLMFNQTLRELNLTSHKIIFCIHKVTLRVTTYYDIDVINTYLDVSTAAMKIYLTTPSE